MYNSVLCAVLAIILHSFLDLDLSFFYLLLITFILLGILTSFNKKSNTIAKRNWLIKVMYIVIICVIMHTNTKMFIAKLIVDKTITTKTSFEEKYNIYEKCNKLLPYNSEYKIKMIKLIEAYEFKYPDKKIEHSKKILECAKYLGKYERYYNKFEIQSKIILNSIELIGVEENEQLLINIEDGYRAIKDNKLIKRNYVNKCLKRKYEINKIAENILQKSSTIKDESIRLKQLTKQFYLLNIEEYEENKNHIENYQEDMYMEKEEALELLLKYKEEAIEKIKEL